MYLASEVEESGFKPCLASESVFNYFSSCWSCFPSLLPFLLQSLLLCSSFISLLPIFKFNLGGKINYKQVKQDKYYRYEYQVLLEHKEEILLGVVMNTSERKWHLSRAWKINRMLLNTKRADERAWSETRRQCARNLYALMGHPHSSLGSLCLLKAPSTLPWLTLNKQLQVNECLFKER